MNRTILFLVMGAAVMSLPSCNGMFGWIYDHPSATVDFGFINMDKATGKGTVYIDATSYTKWTYIDFQSATIDTTVLATDGSEEGEVLSWDLAIHRYDTKTNGGTVMETGFDGLDALAASGKLPDGEWVPDTWTDSTVMVDVSGMMDGNIVYAPSFYNAELSKWLDVDTSTMPPIYTLSGKVYILKTSDGRMAAIRLSNYMNESKVKGFMTLDYIYPLQLK